MTRTANSSAMLRGSHPLRGYPVTYRITPLTRQPGVPAGFMVEEADGDLTHESFDDTGAHRVLMTAGQVRELVQRVTAQRAQVPSQR